MLRQAFVAFAVGAPGCGAPPAAPITNIATASPPALVVRMKRTECLANCPTYTIELWSDGAVVWDGDADVKRVGKARGSIALTEIGRIVGAFEHAGFFELDDRTPRFRNECIAGGCVTVICEATDEPTAIVTIVRGGTAHTVEISACIAELDRAVERIEAVARPWI